MDTKAAPPERVRAAAVGAWTDALGRTDIPGDADFFELGGDSMGAARLMAGLRGAFGQQLPLTLIFFHPVLDDFVEVLSDAVRDLAPAPETTIAAQGSSEAGRFPLSAEQEAQWVAEQVAPGNLAYTELLSLRLTGPLDAERLQRALDRLVDRHEALRTRFPARPDGSPVQEILPAAGAPRLTLRPCEVADDDEARAFALDRLAQPFDLATGPLVRADLLRLTSAEQVLLLSAHHIVVDGPAMEVLLDELRALYVGREPDGEPISYAEYTGRQQTVNVAGQLDYWRDVLAGATDLELPFDRPRSTPRDTAGRRFRFAVPAAVRDGVDALAREVRATRFAVLLAAFQVSLGRWTGRDDVIVGSPVTSRSRPGLERLVGSLVKMVCLRGDLGGDPSFRELLGRTRQAAFGAVAHSDVPFSRVLSEAAPQRDASRSSLFSTTMILQPTPPVLQADLGDVRAVEFPVPRHYAMYDFSLYAWEAADELPIDIEYATALFDEATVRRFADRFTTLLEAVVAAPDKPLSTFDSVGGSELRQMLQQWNDTRADLGPDRCVHELFEEQVRATPDRTAVIAEGRRLTYVELDAEAEQLAARLRDRGAGPEVVVAVSLERSVRLLVTLLAVLKAGGAYLPIGPDWPVGRRDLMLADAGARLLVDDSGITQIGGPSVPADAEPRPGNLAYVLYTSGSTGVPKGVMVPHRAVVNRLRWMRRDCELGRDDVVLQNAVATFDYSVWEFFGPLHMGATVVLPSPQGHRDLAELTTLIRQHGVTVAHFVPSLLRHFVEEPDAGRCVGLRVLFSGGEPLDPSLAVRVQQVLPAVRLYNAYGPTEAAVDVTCWRVPPGPATVAIGGPAANTTCHVLDERMNPLPVGTTGELYLGGVQLARGYRGQPGPTADRFVPDPFGPAGGRLYRTGDRARWRSDGTLDHVGRVDRQLKIRGVRIEPVEVEAALLAHPDVREAAVVAVADRLVAYHRGGPAGGEQDLRAHLAARLPEFALPSVYVTMPDGLPVLPSGKVDLGALPEPASERARPAVDDTSAGGPPLGARELMFAALWSDVLGVDRIGREDSFFQLGGDSILGIQMVARARKVGLEVTVPDLFRTPTLAALAAGAKAKATSAASAEPVGEGPSRFPLTPLQREMLREATAAPGRGLYVVPAELLLDGEADPEAMRAAFRRLVERHPVLRTSVSASGRDQQVHAAAEPSFRYEDWRGHGEDEQERRRKALLTEEWHAGFAPDAEQLSRMVLIRLGERRWAMVWTRHNVLLDGWSFAQLYDELLDLHAALRDGHPEPSAAPRPPFSAYVDWLLPRQRAAAETLWTEQLSELSPRTLFDPDVRPSPADYRELRFDLPQEAVQFAQHQGLTLSTVLEAAWAVVLARRTNCTDVRYGTVFSAREAAVPDVERMLGLMINTLPSGLRLDPRATIAGWLRELYERGIRLKELATADLDLLRDRAGVTGALWDTLLLIHNYPHSFHDVPTGGLRVIDTQGFSRVGAALIASIDVQPLRLAMMYDTARADGELVRQLAAEMAEALDGLTSDPDRPVGELLN